MASEEARQSDYLLNNANELSRLALQHEVIKHAMDGKLVLAPIDLESKPLQVLDLCTADGVWIRDLDSTLQAQHTYIGTDIEKSYFPSTSLANITFNVQDINKPFPPSFASNFDLVHQRLALVSCGDIDSTKAVVSKYVELVKPGGWVQLVDFPSWTDERDGQGWKDFTQCIRDMIESIGSSQQHIQRAKGWFEELGLVHVEEKVVVAKYGARGDELDETSKKAAALTAASILEITSGLPQESLNVQKDRIPNILADVEKELEYGVSHWHYHIVWAQKPE